jgi:hypothetical protein
MKLVFSRQIVDVEVLLYLTLKTGFELTAFGENMKGYATETIFDAPFTKSRTATEFWTKRWNLMIQRFLKVCELEHRLPCSWHFSP